MNEQTAQVISYGICNHAMIPVRSEPSHRAELCTQLLFGETYHIHEIREGWTRICGSFDNYNGWIESKQTDIISQEEFQTCNQVFGIAHEILFPVSFNNISLLIPIGSSIPEINKYSYDGSHLPAGEMLDCDAICEMAKKFLHAPYLWGGRTPMGIDCSGLSQISYKLAGFRIPRDSFDQAGTGSTINLYSEAQPGDLVFFDNDEGKITHVGILLRENQIIHASGKVRIDRIDHQGIFNEETQSYTHKLRVIKRILEN